MRQVKVEIDGKTYIGKEPTGYDVLKYRNKYFTPGGELKDPELEPDATVELVAMVYGLTVEEAKALPLSHLVKLAQHATEVIAIQPEFEKK